MSEIQDQTKLTDLGQWDRPRRKGNKREESWRRLLGDQIWPEWSRGNSIPSEGILLWRRETGTQEAQRCAVTESMIGNPVGSVPEALPHAVEAGGTEVTGYDSGPGRHHSLSVTRSYCPLLVPVYSPGFYQRWRMLPRGNVSTARDKFLFWILWVSSSRGR